MFGLGVSISIAQLSPLQSSGMTLTNATGAYTWSGTYDGTAFSGAETLPAGSTLSISCANWTKLTSLDVSDNALTQASVDQILQTLVSGGGVNGTLDINGNDTPSSAGAANITILEGRSWTVTCNPIIGLFASLGAAGGYWSIETGYIFSDDAGTVPAGVGDTIARINDRSGNNNTATQTNGTFRPQRTADKLAHYDGINDKYSLSLAPALNNSVFVLGKTVANSIFCGCAGSGVDRAFLGVITTGELGCGVGSNSFTVHYGGSSIAGVRGVYSFVNDGSTVKLYNGTTEIYSGAQSGNPSTAIQILMGALNGNGTAGYHIEGDVSEYVWFKQALTDEQRLVVQNYLMSKI